MSRVEFDALGARLRRAPYGCLDLEGESALAPHMREALRSAAAWALRFGVRGGWFQTDYAALAAPDAPPPPLGEVAAILAACRAKGERSRFGARYMDLLLRWAWAPPDRLAVVGLPPPYDPLLAIFDAGCGLSGEHGFVGPGLSTPWVGLPEDHLQAA